MPDEPDEPATSGEPATPVGDGEDLEVLHQTVDELRHENETLRAADQGKGRARLRSVGSWVLLVVACLLAVVSSVVVFGRNQLLNTDTYVNTVAPLASNPAIQTQVATRVSHELIARTDLSDRVRNALPKKASFLVTPITNEVQSATYNVALRLVESEQFQKLWVAANRSSHKQLVAVLTGSSPGVVSTNDGKVSIDLTQVQIAVKKKLDSRGITVFDKVPAAKGLNLVLFQSDQLVKIQRLTRILNKVAVVLPILTLLLFAAAVALARNRRKGLVRAAAGLALSMGLILVVVSVARNQYLSSLSASQSKPANEAVIDTVVAPLQDTVRLVGILAAVVAIIAVVVGVPAIRRWASERQKPEWLTEGPVHGFVAAHRRGLQWATLALGLLVLVLWNKPTTLVAVVVVLITLALIGLVGAFAGRRLDPGARALPSGDPPPG